MIIKGHTIKGGKAEGEALVARTPFSFIGYFDVLTGNVVGDHDLKGHNVVDKILVFPTGMGSTGGAGIVHTGKIIGTAPAGLVCIEAEPTIALAAILNNIPMVDRLEQNLVDQIQNGDYVKLNADEGIIEVVKKSDP